MNFSKFASVLASNSAKALLSLSIGVGGNFLPTAVKTVLADSTTPVTVPTTVNNNGQASGSGTSGAFSPVGQDQQKSGFCGNNDRGSLPVNSPGEYNSPGNDGSKSAANSGCNTTTTTSDSKSDSAARAAAAQYLSSNPKASANDLSSHLQSIGFAPSIATSVANSSTSSNTANNGPQSLQNGINAGNSVYNSRTNVNGPGTRLNLGLGVGVNIDLIGVADSCQRRGIFPQGPVAQLIGNMAKDGRWTTDRATEMYQAGKTEQAIAFLSFRSILVDTVYGNANIQKMAALCGYNPGTSIAVPPIEAPKPPTVTTIFVPQSPENPPAAPQQPTTPSKLF